METAPQNLPFLFAAFAVAWLVFAAYAVYMSWKRQALQREVQELAENPAQSDSISDSDSDSRSHSNPAAGRDTNAAGPE